MIIAGFVATQDQIGRPARVKGEQNAVRAPLVLHPQLLHVGITRLTNHVSIRSTQQWPVLFQEAHGHIDAVGLAFVQVVVPSNELVTACDFPSHV